MKTCEGGRKIGEGDAKTREGEDRRHEGRTGARQGDSASTQSGEHLLWGDHLRAERSLDRLFEPQRQKDLSPLDERKLRRLLFQLMEGAGGIVWRRPLHFADEEGVARRTLGHDVDLQGLAIQAGSPPAAGRSLGSAEGFERGHACPGQLFPDLPSVVRKAGGHLPLDGGGLPRRQPRAIG